MKKIALSQNKFALVDDCDFTELNKFRWYALKNKRTFYAVRNVSKPDGKQTSIKMHRVVTNAPIGMEVDHIDHDGLNNQKSNLRTCTKVENARNKLKTREMTSTYLGVSWHKENKKWRSNIAFMGRQFHLGYFDCEVDAALAYNQAAVKFYGSFTSINIL